MTRNEQQMYSNISSIAKSLEKIAKALDNKVSNELVDATTKDIPGFEGVLNDLDNLYQPNTLSDKCLTANCDGDECTHNDNDDVQNDYLNDLVKNMNHIEYLNFHHDMAFGFASSDTAALNNHIYELEYEECLDAIQRALLITGDSDYIAYAGGDEEAGRNFVKQLLENESLKKDDPYTYETDLQGIRKDDDHDIRVAASCYEEDYATKKEAILDYVTNEFGSQGARYTDIIKFAYYLGDSSGSKFNSTRDRGYYSLGMSGRGAYLIRGGKDFLVKGINKEGDERYFAHSFVESVTDYWKFCDNTKK